MAGVSASNDGDVTGHHGQPGDSDDVWIIKIDRHCNLLWQKSFGGTGEDYAYSIIQTSDSGFVFVGETNSTDGDLSGLNPVNGDYWIVKLNAVGDMQWQKIYGGSHHDYAKSVVQTSDGGFAVTGCTNSWDGNVSGYKGGDYWLIKLDSSGNLLWQKCLGGSNIDIAFSIVQTSDSGFAIAGLTDSNDGDVTGQHGGGDYWVVKTDSLGNIGWQKSLGGSGDDLSYSIIQSAGNGFLIAGVSGSIDGDVTGHHGSGVYSDYWIVKLDQSGNLLWEKSFGGTTDDRAFQVIQAAGNACYVLGSADSNCKPSAKVGLIG